MEDREKILQDIIDNYNNGKLTLMTIDGIAISNLDEITNQPADGLLYDLNRDLGTLFTQAKTSKTMRFVNDIACAYVIKYLIDKVYELENEIEEIKTKSIVSEIEISEEDEEIFSKDKQSKSFYERIKSQNTGNPSKIQEGFNTSLEINI